MRIRKFLHLHLHYRKILEEVVAMWNDIRYTGASVVEHEEYPH